MLDFLKDEKRKRFFIIWMVILSFALFVNLFGITPNTSSDKENNALVFGENRLTKITERNTIYFLTDEKLSENSEVTSHFWPFVNYFGESGMYLGRENYFRGVFVDFDFSEFIAYTLLILLFF